MRVGALKTSLELVSLNRNVVEMVGVVATTWWLVGPIRTGVAVEPGAARIIRHPRPLLLRSEGRAGHFKFQGVRVDHVFVTAVLVPDYALHAIGPRAGHA